MSIKRVIARIVIVVVTVGLTSVLGLFYSVTAC